MVLGTLAGAMLSSQCSNCLTTNTPLWRRGPKGPNDLCNACGIHWGRLGLHRPLDATPSTTSSCCSIEAPGSSVSYLSHSSIDCDSFPSPSQSPAIHPGSPDTSSSVDHPRKMAKREVTRDKKSGAVDIASGLDLLEAAYATSDEEFEPRRKNSKTDPMIDWVMCDFCYKWRKLPSSVPKSSIPDEWTCSMFPVKEHAVCSFRNPSRSTSGVATPVSQKKNNSLDPARQQPSRNQKEMPSPVPTSAAAATNSKPTTRSRVTKDAPDAIQIVLNFAHELATDLLGPYQIRGNLRRRAPANHTASQGTSLGPEEQFDRLIQEQIAIHEFGSIMKDILTLQLPPEEAESSTKISNHWSSGTPSNPGPVRHETRRFVKLVLQCLHELPECRPSSQEILTFTKEFNNEDLDD